MNSFFDPYSFKLIAKARCLVFKPLNILFLICSILNLTPVVQLKPAVVLASITLCGSCSQYSICIRSQLGSPIVSELVVPSITVCVLSVVFVAAATVEFFFIIFTPLCCLFCWCFNLLLTAVIFSAVVVYPLPATAQQSKQTPTFAPPCTGDIICSNSHGGGDQTSLEIRSLSLMSVLLCVALQWMSMWADTEEVWRQSQRVLSQGSPPPLDGVSSFIPALSEHESIPQMFASWIWFICVVCVGPVIGAKITESIKQPSPTISASVKLFECHRNGPFFSH